MELNLPWGEYGYFLELHNKILFIPCIQGESSVIGKILCLLHSASTPQVSY